VASLILKPLFNCWRVTLLQLARVKIFWSLLLYLRLLIRLFPYHSFEHVNCDQSTIFQFFAHPFDYYVQILQILITATAGMWKEDLHMYVPNNVILQMFYNLWKKKSMHLSHSASSGAPAAQLSSATTFTLLPLIAKLKFVLHHQCVRIPMCAIHIPRYVKWYVQWTESMEAYKVSENNYTNWFV